MSLIIASLSSESTALITVTSHRLQTIRTIFYCGDPSKIDNFTSESRFAPCDLVLLLLVSGAVARLAPPAHWPSGGVRNAQRSLQRCLVFAELWGAKRALSPVTLVQAAAEIHLLIALLWHRKGQGGVRSRG